MGTIFTVILFFSGIHFLKRLINSSIQEKKVEEEFEPPGTLKIRIVDSSITDSEGDELPMMEIEGNGFFPIQQDMDVTFVTHVFDKTTGKKLPVHTLLQDFRRKNSQEFEFTREFGLLTPSHHTVDWVSLGAIPLGLIIPPYSGRRRLVASIHIRSKSDVWKDELEFVYEFKQKGYIEIVADRDKGRLLALQLGMVVAGSDGQYAKVEGQIIKGWILKQLDALPEKDRAEQKKIFNDTVKESFIKISEGSLSLSVITQELNRIDDLSLKYEAIDLCFKVLAADGKVNPSEMAIIKKVSDVLELNAEEVGKIKDRAILNLDMTNDATLDIEDLLGIQKNWDNTRKKRHLREQFQKWNNRLNILTAGSERDNAQRMLDATAEARKKYE